MTIDFTTDFGKKVLSRLENEQVIWLTTVAKSGTPQPNPVWFQYVNEKVYIYTAENAVRLKNFVENDRVSLNFNTDEDGENVAVITGRIGIDNNFPKVIDNPAYLEKYKDAIPAINSTPEKLSEEFPVVMCVTPSKLRGW